MTNLTLIRRDDVDLDLTFTDKDGEAINLTGCTVFFTMKEKKTDTDDDAVIQKEITDHTTPLEGKTRVTLTNSETDITPRHYFYDVQIVDTDDKVISSSVGQIKILQDVTIRTSEAS